MRGRLAFLLFFCGACGSAPAATTQPQTRPTGMSGSSGQSGANGGSNSGGAGGNTDIFSGGGASGGAPIMTAGMTGSGGAGCGLVTKKGVCATPTQVQRCVLATGQGTPSIVTEDCSASEQCTAPKGLATCAPLPGTCEPGERSCVDANTGHTCNANGAYQTFVCHGCAPSGVGVVCPGDNGTATKVTGKLDYEAKGPNSGLTDWTTTTTSYFAQGVLAVSYHADATGTLTPIDTTVTDANGAFTLDLAATPAPNDEIVFFAAGLDANKNTNFSLAEAPVPDGTWNLATVIPATKDTAIWSWSKTVSAITDKTAANVHVTIDEHSGALRVFDYMRYVHNAVDNLLGKAGTPLVAWLRYGTSWSCHSCFLPSPITSGGVGYDSQIFYAGSEDDEEFWADSVTAHELGHWVMESYGTPPNEAGRHCVGVPEFPGIAWSEGWATSVSAIVRDDSVYVDKANGVFFWFDLAKRAYSDTSGADGWHRPAASAGLLQPIEENEVAAMMFALSTPKTTAIDRLHENAAIFAALSSDRMNHAPFFRGNTVHVWSDVDASCKPEDPVDTGTSAPQFADFLDALVCGGEAAASVDAVTMPMTTYPYPSASPECMGGTSPANAPDGPLDVAFERLSDERPDGTIAVRVALRSRAPRAAITTADVIVPAGLRLLSGTSQLVLTGGAEIEQTLRFAVDHEPNAALRLVVDLRGGGIGAHGVRAIDFGDHGRSASPPRAELHTIDGRALRPIVVGSR